MSPILGIWASQNYPRVTNSYESIATSLISTNTLQIDFSSIPSTYKHLQLRYIVSCSGTNNTALTFNSDTGANYSWHYISGNGTSAGAGTAGANQSKIIQSSPPAGTYYQGGIIDILDYQNTNKYKTVRWLEGADQNGSGEISLFSGLWMSTSAISTISLNAQGTNRFIANSQFALYGIRG